MRVSLREISDDNEAAVRALRTTAGQEQFVSTVNYSLREAAEEPEGNPWYRAIYADDKPVGFVMLAWNVTPRPPEIIGPWYLWKLLVDHRHQGKGYGHAALDQITELVRAEGATELLTSYVPGEGSPAGFYARLGFVETGERNADGEIIVRRSLK